MHQLVEYYRMEHDRCDKFIDLESSLETHSVKKCHTHIVIKGQFVECVINLFLFVEMF